ncbi:MAG: hypothetical protein H6983_06015 [Ectothiorhodospiraceae bacterium]|nr:hypothetical protein [Chromatiales bacterium]MCP5153699.1 hypothetical protein [Ectothiorhodospiraceae bacterium]
MSDGRDAASRALAERLRRSAVLRWAAAVLVTASATLAGALAGTAAAFIVLVAVGGEAARLPAGIVLGVCALLGLAAGGKLALEILRARPDPTSRLEGPF